MRRSRQRGRNTAASEIFWRAVALPSQHPQSQDPSVRLAPAADAEKLLKSSSISVFGPCDLVFIVLLRSFNEVKLSFDVPLLLPLSEPSRMWRNQSGSHVQNRHILAQCNGNTHQYPLRCLLTRIFRCMRKSKLQYSQCVSDPGRRKHECNSRLTG